MTVLQAGTHGAKRSVLDHALKNHLTFKTSGALSGTRSPSLSTGALNETEKDQYYVDYDKGISFVVLSYCTPIAWVRADGTVYKVAQKFSVTTSSRHQSKLYLLDM